MPRVTVDLEDPSGQSIINGRWRFAIGYIPGEPNEGLTAQGEGSPARLPGYDDSGWEYCGELPARISHGFSFVWYRINITFPDTIGGRSTEGVRAQFETCVDDYGEIWIDGECSRERGVIQGFNVPQRVQITANASPGEQHCIAVLAANGPLAAPGGATHMRYANIAFEWTP